MNLKENKSNIEKVKELYNSPEAVWPVDDLWHIKTFETINKTVHRWLNDLNISPEYKLLNAGAGTSRYNINCIKYDCDINEALIADSDNPITASIENIPFRDGFFDVCICVGSVINYCDAATSIIELSRVLSENGFFILEFESSDSAEFLFTSKYHKSVISKVYSYNNSDHNLWLYSEKYIYNLLKEAGLSIIEFNRFHTASSLNYRFFHNQDKAAKYIKHDKIFMPISRFLAHNRILLCQKSDYHFLEK